MTKNGFAALAVILVVAAGLRAQPPNSLPMPTQVAPPAQPAPDAQALPQAVPAPAPPGPGCGDGCCGRVQVSCLKRFCNWITYHPLTRGCECGCGCGCCSDCCGYHGFQPLYTYFLLPCQGAPPQPPAGGCASCGGHGLLGKFGICSGCHGAPITPPGIDSTPPGIH